MADKSYKVTVSGEGISIEREVDKTIGDQIVVLLLTGAQATVHNNSTTTQGLAGTQQPAKNSSSGADLSIREVLDLSGAKRAPDKITVMGKYIKDTRDEDFTRDDVVEMFEAAAEKVPGNLARDLKWTLKAGWITERTGVKGKYYVTHTGLQAVTAEFSKEFVKKSQGLLSGNSKRTTPQNGEN